MGSHYPWKNIFMGVYMRNTTLHLLDSKYQLTRVKMLYLSMVFLLTTERVKRQKCIKDSSSLHSCARWRYNNIAILWYCKNHPTYKFSFLFSWHQNDSLALINQTAIRTPQIDFLFRLCYGFYIILCLKRQHSLCVGYLRTEYFKE